MSTVKETNEIFAKQNLNIKLPYPEDWQVKSIDILEKKDLPGGVDVLLGIKMIDEIGHEISDLYFTSSEFEREPIVKMQQEEIKKDKLPLRDKFEFANEKEASDYLKYAIESLIKDKGYTILKKEGVDLYGEKAGRGFFIFISPKYNDECYNKTEILIKMRGELGDANDYGIVTVAFQQSLGVSPMDQDDWLSQHINNFSRNHMAILAVDNKNPNTIYPLTVYPKEKEMRIYFLKTSTRWTLVQSRARQQRSK